MSLFDPKDSMGLAVAAGSVLAAGFYMGSSTFLTGPTGELLPIMGSIGIAGIVPAFMSRPGRRRKLERINQFMHHQVQVLNSHALINVVDNRNRLTEVNDGLLEATGYTREQLIGKPVSTLYDTAYLQLAKKIRAGLVRGETWRGETPLRHADGTILHTQATIKPIFDAAGTWIGSISARTDITATKQLIADHQIVETLHQLREDVWIVDAQSETFSYMNGAALRRTGWTAEEMTSKSLSDLGHKSGDGQILRACRSLRESGEVTTHFETTFRDQPFHVSIKFLKGIAGKDSFLILLNDIGERVEQERRKLEFVSTVSHELRSPLTSIKGAMGLLLSKATGELPPKAVGMLEIAHRNADRLILIINDILDLEKIANGEMEFELQDADLSEIVREACTANDMLQQRFGVTLRTVGCDDPLPLRTDPNRVIQVLTNLLTNAYKFSKPGGTITIQIIREDSQLRVSVQDEGAGILASEQHKIFERFVDMTNSDRATKGGTGLGLNICKAIIERLGGTIGFESKEGVGSTFNILLPRTHVQDGPAEQVENLKKAS